MRKLVLLLVAAGFCSSFAIAQDGQKAIWKGVVDEFWRTPAQVNGNWRSKDMDGAFQDALPVEFNNVVFEGKDGELTCTLLGPVSIGRFTVGDKNNGNVPTLTLEDGASITAAYTKYSAVGWGGDGALIINEGASITTGADFRIAGKEGVKGKIDVAGTLTIATSLNFGLFGGNSTAAGGEGNLNVLDNGTVNLGSLDLDPTDEIALDPDAEPKSAFIGDFGLITISENGTLIIGGDKGADLATHYPNNIVGADGVGIEVAYNAEVNKTVITNVLRSIDLPVLGVESNVVLDFEMYPNPTSNMVNIKSSTPISKIGVFNTLGQKVLANAGKSTIDISSLSAGYYILKIADAKGSVGVRKIVKK